jgi:hypothetical protein
MKTAYIKRSMSAILFLALMACASTSFAAHKISNPLPPDGFDVSLTAPPQQWQTDFEITWTAPDDMASDTLIGYAYKWSESETPLTHTTYLGNESSYDGMLEGSGEIDPPTIFSLTSADIAEYDGELRYLHVQTVYEPSGSFGTFTLSEDTVIGPCRIDNVSPDGTIRLPDLDNPSDDLVTTRETTVAIEVGGLPDVAQDGLYLMETTGDIQPTLPESGVPVTTEYYTLSGVYTTPVEVTIWAWLKDEAGNISSLPPVSFTLLDPISIDPYTATIDLAVTDTMNFKMAGTDEGYTWSVEQEKDENGSSVSAGTIATITTDQTTPPNSITVQGLEKGTFTLRATPNVGGSDLTSGTITVSLSAVTVTFTLQKNASTTSVNAISLALPVNGLNKASDLYAAIPNIDGLSRWDVTTQSYASYVPGLSFTDFDLVLGEPYFVSVSASGTYDMVAPVGAITFNLQKNTSTTSVNAISLPYDRTDLTKASQMYAEIPNIDGLSRWDVTTQSYASYVPGLTFTDFDLVIGEPYFVSVSASGNWQ